MLSVQSIPKMTSFCIQVTLHKKTSQGHGASNRSNWTIHPSPNRLTNDTKVSLRRIAHFKPTPGFIWSGITTPRSVVPP